MSSKSLVVTGATGQLGRLVIESLLEKGVPADQVVATARDTSRLDDLAARGVQVRHADYSDPASLKEAFAGADRVLLVSSSEVGQRLAQHQNVIDAAKDAGVDLLAYTSIANGDRSGLALAAEHVATEQAIAGSGLAHTFLRNSWYLENYTGQLPTYLEHGVVLGAAGEGRVSAASRADFAEAAAAVLLTEEPKQVYELGGAAFTLPELAATVTEVTGKEVSYNDLPADALTEVLVGAGLPEQYAAILADADQGLGRGELYVETTDLEALLGRPATTLTEALTEALRAA
ncbi:MULTISPECIES: SDR family oxidoreductase [unclassified Nocardioides]|uniref:SDR family oxidoreductase n=1 Tax=unclassified Nocardioides TaxID=2615069 RepID=UPI000701D36A|nr:MULTISPECIES: SDR family oxidoreductase [unclassified Nocardioides]KRA32340.1 NAD(P)-dependent oxidoreductase [Nocardioides sp. Root614]KRA88992.1 NAD(P)-dependent oxidoreductase [Nocardioides sp. Root682]